MSVDRSYDPTQPVVAVTAEDGCRVVRLHLGGLSGSGSGPAVLVRALVLAYELSVLEGEADAARRAGETIAIEAASERADDYRYGPVAKFMRENWRDLKRALAPTEELVADTDGAQAALDTFMDAVREFLPNLAVEIIEPSYP